MRLNRWVLVTLCILLSCNETEDSGFAPTGAKGTTNEFGEVIYVDEECGGRDSAMYPETFQNALFRDGAVEGDRLWLVDGSHLWAVDGLAVTPETLQAGRGAPTPKVIFPFAGHANAVTTGDNFVAVALVDRGVLILPGGDPRQVIYLQDTARAMDVAARGTLLAVGAGGDGVMVYDLANPKNPLPLFSSAVTGYVAGVEWARESAGPMLYYAACSQIGRFDFQNGFNPAGWASTTLWHRNAKDIAAKGNNVFVANNGEGIWFYNAQFELYLEQEPEDPNFYANAVAIDAKTVYLAAGNRELTAYRLWGTQLTSVPRDPIGVLAYDNMVYGFGNFRDVGERTVIRSRTIDSSSIAEFEHGLPDLTEPYYLQPATALTQSGEMVYRISTVVDGANRVYERMLTDASWRLVPNLKFFGNAGRYAVAVSSDNELRVYLPDQIEPVFTNRDSVISTTGSEMLAQYRYRTFDTGLIVSLFYSGVRQDILYSPSTYSADWVASGLERIADLDASTLNATGMTVNYLGYPKDGSAIVPLWTELTSTGEDAHSLIVGSRATESGSIDWVSSQFTLKSRKKEFSLQDDILDGNAKEPLGVGAIISGCDACGRLIRQGGLIDVLPWGDGAILMFDERRAGTTALVFLDGTAREKQRWIHFGRPSGLTRDGSTVRAWFADGSSFRFDPSGVLVRLDVFDAVIR